MEIGNAYLFLTLGFYWTGRLVALNPSEYIVEEAAQVFDLGELEHALKTGEVKLCQAVPDMLAMEKKGLVARAYSDEKTSPWRPVTP